MNRSLHILQLACKAQNSQKNNNFDPYNFDLEINDSEKMPEKLDGNDNHYDSEKENLASETVPKKIFAYHDKGQVEEENYSSKDQENITEKEMFGNEADSMEISTNDFVSDAKKIVDFDRTKTEHISSTSSSSHVSDSTGHLNDDFNNDILNNFYSSESEYIPNTDDESSDLHSEASEEYHTIPSIQTTLNVKEINRKSLDTPEPMSTNTINVISDGTIETTVSPCNPEPLPGPSHSYVRNCSARERPTICPICFKDVTHFTRHLLRHHKNHKEVCLLNTLKPKSKERLALVAALRKQGYFILKTEKNITLPVKSSKKLDAEYFVCTYCLGQYTKQLLFKHVKKCKNKPKDIPKSTGKYLTASQTFMALIKSKNGEFLKSSRVKNEVFTIMHPDGISEAVKNDPLICLYGETLLSKHKRQQIVNAVSNKMREMGRLLIGLRSICSFDSLLDALKPEYFQYLVSVTKEISGYDVSTKSPSLAMHMGTNLKTVCDVAYKLILEKRNIPGIKWKDHQTKKSEIKDLKKLIEGHWCNELSSLALKNLREKHWEKSLQLPLTTDLQLFNEYINKLADESFCQLNSNIRSNKYYKQLADYLLAKTIIFNRKRVGDVQYLTIQNYNKEYSTINQENFADALTEVEKIIYRNHKRVVSGGKGSKPVPILFSKQSQKYVNCLLKIRQETEIVPNSNPYLFANPNSENRWIDGANTIRKMAKNCGAQQPHLLTSTRFRKHIATTLQLLSLDDGEMEQIATFMGHTKKTHEEFYRLPLDIYQTSKVAKILLLMEKGRGNQFRGKKLNEIDIGNEVYYSSESDDEEPVMQKVLKKVSKKEENDYVSSQENIAKQKEPVREKTKESFETYNKKKITERSKWSSKEKDMVSDYFKNHIKNHIAPKKHECEQFLSLYPTIFENKNWVRIKTYVYNKYRKKL